MNDFSGITHPFGLATGDLALLVGGIGLVFAVLCLGISSNTRGRRWLARLGWLVLILSVVSLGYGTTRSTASAASQPN